MTVSTDFNDLAVAEGLEAVADIVSRALPLIDGYGEDDFTPDTPHREPWKAPTIPGVAVLPDIPAGILPGAWGDMARAVAASTQTPVALSVMCALGVLATLVQRRFEVMPHGLDGGYSEPLSLWVVSASPSGTRKTAVMGHFLAPILKWEKLQYDRFRVLVARTNAARSTSKKRIEALNQQSTKCKDATELAAVRDEIEREELGMPEEVRAPRLFTGDTTAERLQALLVENSERMAVHSDEPGIFRVMAGSYSGGSQNLDVFLQGHAGSAMRIDRAGRMAHVDKPALSFNLMIQPGLMSEVAGSAGFRSSGLLARFLFAIPESNVGARDVRKHSVIPPSVKAAYEQAVMNLLDGYLVEAGTVPKVQALDLSESASEHWFDFAQSMEDRSAKGRDLFPLIDWVSKLAGAVARVAAILELAREGVGAYTVQFDSMDKAVILANALIPHAQRAFGLLGADSVEKDAQAVLNWVQVNGKAGFTRREAQKAMESRFKSVDKLKSALSELVSTNCLRELVKANTGARASVFYAVNPLLTDSVSGTSLNH